MSSRNENLNLETDCYAIWTATGVLDGTDTVQSLAPTLLTPGQRNPTDSRVPCEPELARSRPNQCTLDQYTRAFISVCREEGIGAAIPTGTLRLYRENTTDFTDHDLGGIFEGPFGKQLVIDPVYPANFARSSPSPLLGDNLQCELLVDPNEAAAHNICCMMIILPSFPGRSSRRGNIVSGHAYY